MSLVIGVKTHDAIVIASDGLGLIRGDDGDVRKVHTHSKIRALESWGVLLAFVGAVETCADVVDYVRVSVNTEIQGLPERDFLRHLSEHLATLRASRNDGAMGITLLVAYRSEGSDLALVCFEGDTARPVDRYISIGPAAAKVTRALHDLYDDDWDVGTAVGVLVDMIYLGSEIPTVNFLPMIAVLSRDSIQDYSKITITEFHRFQNRIRTLLVEKTSGPKCLWS